MAEHGAHLATVSTELPSIFEVLAQENLSSTLGPAFGHLVKAIAQVDVGRFEHLFKWHQEVFSALELILQHYCLKSCGASFSENFYGLKRAPLGNQAEFRRKSGYALPLAHHRRALACLVLIPYIRLKLDSYYENLQDKQAEQTRDNNDKWLKLKLIFLKLYPLVHLSWEICALIYQVSYALDKTTFSSPLYHMAKTQLVLNDDSSQQPLFQLWSDVTNNGWLKIPQTIYHHLTSNTRELFTSSLSIGTFFLQYLEWWYSNKNNASSEFVTVIPFPVKDSAQVEVPKGKSCPLCAQQRKNDTVLSVSGYVFCYPCIYRFVSENGVCPVTKLPADTDRLVRLFTVA